MVTRMIEVMRLTTASHNDVDDLAVLAKELRGKDCAMTAGDLSSMLADPHIILVVARDNDHIVGMATLYILQEVGKRGSYLENVIISARYQGQGLGEGLVRTLIDMAREHAVESIKLTSRPERIAAHKLYEKLGFKKYETDVFKLSLAS